MCKRFLFLFLFAMLATNVINAEENYSVTAEKILFAAPIKVTKPIFSDSVDNSGNKFSAKAVLEFPHFNFKKYTPNGSVNVPWSDKVWDELSAKSGKFTLGKINSEIIYLANYLSNKRWIKGKLIINSNVSFALSVDNKNIEIFETKSGKAEANKELELIRGKHKIILKLYSESEITPDISIKFEADTKFKDADIQFDNRHIRGMDIYDILDGKKVAGSQISYKGEYAIINYSENYSKDDSKNWIEIMDLTDNSVISVLPVSDVSQVKWLPKSNRISYILKEDKKSSLYISDIKSGQTERIITQADDFGGYVWADDESNIIYQKNHTPEEQKGVLKRFAELEDRHPWWRNRSLLFQYDIKTKISQQLTWGYLTTSLQDISSDGKKLIFSTERPQYKERQYAYQNMYLLDLETMNTEILWENRTFPCTAQFSPDDSKLIVIGGPSAFGKIGENVPDGKTPNNYDTQAYIYDLSSKSVEAISKDFNPTIESANWNKINNKIYFNVEDKSYNRLYAYDTQVKKYEMIETGFDISSRFSFASDSLVMLFMGESVQAPKRIVKMNLDDNKATYIASPEEDNYQNVEFGKFKNWDFVTNQNDTIIGRVYMPADFDPNKKYPLIVYYYGGTSPVTRTFGGRYPFNVYAAQGYVVYVLQPSGATGFGQEFSARHVNNWGITVADEIIDATKDFLKKNEYCDSKKVGCIGASYGGFMTMLLQTRTDIFSAAISHAGISSISSYWGEGYWGYSYSAEASANSFPWNNKELYIEQSPLFNADKVKTPILLLHGDSDTNVPVGESIQFFTALKLLGSPVELVTIKSTDHHVVSYEQRVEWNNAIFAWFDYWLKGEKEWWENMFPKVNY